MAKTKDLLEQLNHEDSAVEFYARLNLLKECQEDLIDPEVSPEMKKIIIKAILV